MKKKSIVSILLLTIILFTSFLAVSPVSAQEDQPVVYAAFFYSPSCGHCHKVITEDFPLWQEEFGDQVMVLFINVATEEGSQLFVDTFQAMEIPPERAGGVPALVVGDNYLVGSIEIPEQFPVIVREGLANGGIAIPDVPASLRETFLAAIESEGQTTSEEGSSSEETQEGSPTAAPPDPGPSVLSDRSMIDVFMTDPLANGISVFVLLLLVGSFIAISIPSARGLLGASADSFSWLGSRKAWIPMLLIAFVALVIVFTIVFEPSDDILGKVFSFMALAFTVASVLGLFIGGKKKRGTRVFEAPSWLLVVVLLAGLSAASYLAYAELSIDTAFCGTVGDCNTVQQSTYAMLFGLLPMAILGLIGYLAMIFAWMVTLSSNKVTAALGKIALLGFALFGTAFSIYLTFLEPFVIGATCAWCLTSAVVMMLALWLVAKDGVEAFDTLRAGA